LRQLGQQYFPNLSFGQNATTLAEVIYDWTFSTYRRVQFPLVARSHVDVLCDLIDYWPLDRFPKVAWMFNLTATSRYDNCQQLKNGKFKTAENWGLSEGNLINYALSISPTKPTYSQYSMMYRGDGREKKVIVDFLFCFEIRNIENPLVCSTFVQHLMMFIMLILMNVLQNILELLVKHFKYENWFQFQFFLSLTPQINI
jgi:hypothetical protein